MAGNDIPDLVQMPIWMNLPQLPTLLNSRFADLSDHLSGSKVRDYPNLAGIPTFAWRNARINGRIFGVPLSRPLINGPLMVRADLFEKLGVEYTPGTAAEFEALCKEVTAAKSRRWALASAAENIFCLDFFLQMYGAPRVWAQDKSGKLVRDYETPEYAEAVEFARKLNEKGYYHPDSLSANPSQLKELFASGAGLMHLSSLSSWRAYYQVYEKSTPGLKVDSMVPFGHDGGKGRQFFDTGIFSLTAIKKGDDKRVEELLRILNWFAAPYGSAESDLRANGVEGVDFKRDREGTPVPTDRGTAEKSYGGEYISTGAPILSAALYREWGELQHAWEEKVAPLGVKNPASGLYSDTASKDDARLVKAMTDTVNSVIAGRKSMSDFTAAVKSWRSGGGDRIRSELEEAIANEKK